MDAIDDHAALLDALAALPPPPPGSVRVYRGQTADYPAMLPTMLRGDPDPRDFVWQLYAGNVGMALAGDAGPQGEAEVGSTFELLSTWVHAVKQHYGPGTQHLDVTHSPGVAAWFALHRAEIVEQTATYGTGAAPSPADVPGRHEVIQFLPTTSPGYLYAFDVPAPGAGLPGREHGTLVDLAAAPRAFAEAPRVEAQQGCLLYADDEVDGGDLSCFLVGGTPLPVAWPLQGCDEVGWPVNRLFPPVDEDPWYQRFVAIPLRPQLDDPARGTEFGLPIRVGLYLPVAAGHEPDVEGLETLLERTYCVPPPLAFPRIAELAAEEDHPAWEVFPQATPLLLEGPLYVALPPLGDKWNLGLLAGDHAATAPVFDFTAREEIGEASLENVFVELSPLELAGWEKVGSEAGFGDVLRGVWLLRDGGQWLVTYFTTDLDEPEPIMRRGPIPMRYRPDRRSFETSLDNFVWLPLAEVSSAYQAAGVDLAGRFLKTLALVRSLAPGWKVDPHVGMSALMPGRLTTHVKVHWALADLVSLAPFGGPLASYHVLRDFAASSAFMGGPTYPDLASAGTLTFHDVTMAEADPEQLREAVRMQDLAPPERPPAQA